jgi:hypothetical protein
MVYEVRTTLAPDEVLDRAERFFSERVPLQAAFPERRGTGFLVLRGQGGEEIALAAREGTSGTAVRGSTLFFDHALERFLATLPAAVS